MIPSLMFEDLIREAAQIIAFMPKAGVPTITVAGVKLVLSNWWAAMDLLGADEGGAKFIRTGDPDKFRYLWVHDTEGKDVRMWRVSDGDEKVSATDRQLSHDLAVLQKKGQLNRVTTRVLSAIETEMAKKADGNLAALKASVAASKSELEHELDKWLQKRASVRVRPLFFKALADIRAGVTPIGFKSLSNAKPGTSDFHRQAASHVFSKLWTSEMAETVVEKALLSDKFPVAKLGNQDLEFALSSLSFDLSDEWLPPRGR